jgi:hypothetical protein
MICAKCEFCGEEGKEGVKGHVIPESFFWDIVDQPGNVLKQRSQDSFPKRRPVGIYETDAWCRDCEVTHFQHPDNYAIGILRTPIEQFKKEGRPTAAYLLDIESPDMLKLFFICLLWRAAVSRHELFREVELDKDGLNQVVEMIKTKTPGDVHDFGVIVATTDGDPHIISDAKQHMEGGIRYFRFYLGRFVAQIKVDKNPLPSHYILPAVHEGVPFAVIKNAPKSSMFEGYRSIATSSLNHKDGKLK